jgi:HEAT repeat protein
MRDTALVEMIWEFLNAPDWKEKGRRLRKCLIARQADVPDIILYSAEFDDRLLAAWALAQLDPSQVDIILPVLIDGLKSQSDGRRAWAAEACRDLGPRASSAVPALIEVLKNDEDHGDETLFARNRAIGALGEIGPAAASAVPTLVELLHGVGPGSSIMEIIDARNSAAALGSIGPSADAAVSALQECLNLDGSGDECIRWLRLEASEAIWRIKDVPKPALTIATEILLSEEEWWLRCYAAELLGKLGPTARPAIAILQRSCNDEDEHVRKEAGKALAAITNDRAHQNSEDCCSRDSGVLGKCRLTDESSA